MLRSVLNVPGLALGIAILSASITTVQAICTPFRTDFKTLDGFHHLGHDHQYALTTSGLELYIDRPSGRVKSKDGVNDKLATGSTVNSTFTFSHGKATFEISSPRVKGLVTAAIMVSVDTSGDELDVEILGSDPHHWQTNMYAPPKAGAEPEYGVRSTIEDVKDIKDTHRYFIDFDEDRIQWGVDETIVRTLTKESTKRDGKYTYPSHEMRLQIALWDGSGAPGTSKWAGGPVDWTTAPNDVKAVVRGVTLECA